MKTSWICAAMSSLSYRSALCTPTSATVQSPTPVKTKRKYQKKFLASKTGHKPNCFFPSVEYHQNTGEIVFLINCNDRLLEKTLVYKENCTMNKFVIAINDNYQNVGRCTMILTWLLWLHYLQNTAQGWFVVSHFTDFWLRCPTALNKRSQLIYLLPKNKGCINNW